MPYYPPDTPPSEPPQMPQAAMPGIAPVPFTGPDQSAGVITYAATGVSFTLPGAEVMGGAGGDKVQESGYAHDTGAGLVADYSPGALSPVAVGGDADAGGRDVVASTPAEAVANAEARYLEHEGKTHPAGSTVGDLLGVPVETAGNFGGAFYDPPRDYGAH